MTQNEAILSYLQGGGKLTSLEALRLFGCSRLASRIWDLKQMGFDIDDDTIELESGKHVKLYRMASNQTTQMSPVQFNQVDPGQNYYFF